MSKEEDPTTAGLQNRNLTQFLMLMSEPKSAKQIQTTSKDMTGMLKGMQAPGVDKFIGGFQGMLLNMISTPFEDLTKALTLKLGEAMTPFNLIIEKITESDAWGTITKIIADLVDNVLPLIEGILILAKPILELLNLIVNELTNSEYLDSTPEEQLQERGRGTTNVFDWFQIWSQIWKNLFGG